MKQNRFFSRLIFITSLFIMASPLLAQEGTVLGAAGGQLTPSQGVGGFIQPGETAAPSLGITPSVETPPEAKTEAEPSSEKGLPETKVEAKPETSSLRQEKESAIERLLSGKISSTISTSLKQFGYDLFRRQISTFAPVADVPVGPDYVIGPGDSFKITLWGKIEANYPVVVDREGKIILPEVGAISVWGLTLSELKDVLQAELSKYVQDFQLAISMGRLRTIRVFVVGKARVPGSYSLSSLSTMINALFASGGPTKNATMRNIQLIRNGKLVKTLDLYDFLLKGDKSQDERLQPGDTIFIPLIGEVAGIAGNVKEPAIYEMKERLTVEELIKLAGGVTPTGYLQRVQVERIVAHKNRVVVDLNLSQTPEGEEAAQLKTRLQDRDMVKVYPIVTHIQNNVVLEGHVVRPGDYEFKAGMRLSDLIPSYEDLLPESHLDYGEIIRLEEPDFHERVIPFNLRKVLEKSPKHDLSLQRFDKVKIYSKQDFEDKYIVNIRGEVRRPGKFILFDNMKIRDLVEKAGEFKESAYLKGAELTRMVIDQQGVKTEQLEIDLEKAMQGDPKHNILLQKYDTLQVRIIPDWKEKRVANLKGEVRFPGTYNISKEETLFSLIRRAGGYTDEAYLRGAIFTRESVKAQQQERLDGLIRKHEIDIQTISARITAGALSKDEDDLAIAQQTLSVQKELLRKLKAAKVTGRIVVKLAPLDELAGSEYDIKLKDGDELTIPLRPDTVGILGEVYNPTSVLYRENRTLSYYLNKVGGPTENADEDEIYLVRVDGSVISRSQKTSSLFSWDAENKRWISGGFMSTRLGPGDIILVPRELEKIQWLRATSNITQILYEIVIAAGITAALF